MSTRGPRYPANRGMALSFPAVLLLSMACAADVEGPLAGNPEVRTLEVFSPYTDHALVAGEITKRGDATLTDHGFVWATHREPTVADGRLSLGSPAAAVSFEGRAEPLEQNTSYYVRAFVESEGGDVVYGNELSFTTLTENTWIARSELMGEPLSAGASFVVNERLYVGTGFRTAYTASFYEYDYRRDTWRQVATMPASARAYAIAFSIGDYGYVGLGNTCVGSGLCTHEYFNDLWRYDPGTNSWSRMADLPARGRAFSAVFVIGENAYVTGGSTVDDRDLWRYSVATDTWTRLADYPGACISRGTAFAVGNKGYVGLGWSDGSCDDVWEYDPETDSWTGKADFPGGPRYHAVSFTRGDEAFVACGVYQQFFEPLEYLTDLWRYDPASDTWTEVESTYAGAGRIEMAYGIIGSRVFMGLGANDISHGPDGRFADLWEYVPAK